MVTLLARMHALAALHGHVVIKSWTHCRHCCGVLVPQMQITTCCASYQGCVPDEPGVQLVCHVHMAYVQSQHVFISQ